VGCERRRRKCNKQPTHQKSLVYHCKRLFTALRTYPETTSRVSGNAISSADRIPYNEACAGVITRYAPMTYAGCSIMHKTDLAGLHSIAQPTLHSRCSTSIHHAMAPIAVEASWSDKNQGRDISQATFDGPFIGPKLSQNLIKRRQLLLAQLDLTGQSIPPQFPHHVSTPSTLSNEQLELEQLTYELDQSDIGEIEFALKTFEGRPRRGDKPEVPTHRG
jgi:hypothetical protein